MNNKEKEQWLRETYKYTRHFDFRILDKYEDANEDLHIDDLILDYTLLYEFYKERTKKLNNRIKELVKLIEQLVDVIVTNFKENVISEYFGMTVEEFKKWIIKALGVKHGSKR